VAKKEESLVPQQPAYLANVANVSEVLLALKENLGEESASKFDFPKITVPTGTNKHMIVSTAENPDGEARTTISGILIANHMARAYWKEGADASGVGSSVPDCKSEDSITGEGDPGGTCSTCLYAQFGSDKEGKGRGQACKQMRSLYLLMPGMLLPVLINVPPTSLANARKYLFRLSAEGRPQYTVETEIGIQSKTNSDNQPFSLFTFKRVRFLEGEEMKAAQQYNAMFSALLRGREEYPEVPGPAPAPVAEEDLNV
jgi:hypothetical protein